MLLTGRRKVGPHEILPLLVGTLLLLLLLLMAGVAS
jgi:hypothetical protein